MSYLPLKFDPSNIFPKEVISVRPDVHITFSSGTLPKNIMRESATTSPVFELSYSRKNSMRAEVNSIPMELRPGYASLGFLGEVSSCSEYDSGDEVELYSIWVSPCAFDDFCESVCNKSGIGFRSFQKHPYSFCDFKNDVREESVINKLDTCLAKGPDQLNKLLLESYILELLSINIQRLLCKEDYTNQISKTDMQRLTYAREVLLNRLESPPTLLELSRMIHMNDYKLKKSFKQFFGKTVYQFIREQRLEKAFALLEQGNHNVSETAYAVGYTNVSHFSGVFQKKFGITPHTLKK